MVPGSRSLRSLARDDNSMETWLAWPRSSKLSIPQRLPQAPRGGLLQHRRAQRDVGEREAAVPEQDGLVVALAARLLSRDDLRELAVQSRLRELARLDMGAQRAELAALALAPVVDHQLVHRVCQRQLHRAHGAVGHHEVAGLHPEIGRAHVCTPVTNAPLVCRLLLQKKHTTTNNVEHTL